MKFFSKKRSPNASNFEALGDLLHKKPLCPLYRQVNNVPLSDLYGEQRQTKKESRLYYLATTQDQ